MSKILITTTAPTSSLTTTLSPEAWLERFYNGKNLLRSKKKKVSQQRRPSSTTTSVPQIKEVAEVSKTNTIVNSDELEHFLLKPLRLRIFPDDDDLVLDHSQTSTSSTTTSLSPKKKVKFGMKLVQNNKAMNSAMKDNLVISTDVSNDVTIENTKTVEHELLDNSTLVILNNEAIQTKETVDIEDNGDDMWGDSYVLNFDPPVKSNDDELLTAMKHMVKTSDIDPELTASDVVRKEPLEENIIFLNEDEVLPPISFDPLVKLNDEELVTLMKQMVKTAAFASEFSPSEEVIKEPLQQNIVILGDEVLPPVAINTVEIPFTPSKADYTNWKPIARENLIVDDKKPEQIRQERVPEFVKSTENLISSGRPPQPPHPPRPPRSQPLAASLLHNVNKLIKNILPVH